MADKGQPASPEKAQKASPNRENPVIETLKTAIANSDGNSGDISSVEKAAQEYIAKDKTLEQYFKTHPEKLEEYKNELVRILKNYNGDVNQIRVYCEMALKNLDQSLKVTFREAANRIVDIARDHCVTLTSTNYAPTSFNDVKNTAQYFGHLYNEGSLGSQKQRYKEYLIGHPEEARKFIEFWSKDNAVKYLLSTQGEEGKKIIQGMDSFKESIKTANTKEAAKGLDIKGNTDSDQVAKIASLLRQSDGKAQIISAF